VSHHRTEIYKATRAVLRDANTAAGDRIFIERTEPVTLKEQLPAIFLGMGESRLERGTDTTRFEGRCVLTLEFVADGEDGEKGAEQRDDLVEEGKVALLAPSSVWTRWTSETEDPGEQHRFVCTDFTETPRRIKNEGARLLSTCVLELELTIAESPTDPDEDLDDLDQVVVTNKTTDPDDETVEMVQSIPPGSVDE